MRATLRTKLVRMAWSQLPDDVRTFVLDRVFVPPACVCTSWAAHRRTWLVRAERPLRRLQRTFRERARTCQQINDDVNGAALLTHAMLLRMYMVHYPFEYLQRWPDLAKRKCPHLTDAQACALRRLPPSTQRTRRHVRDVLTALTLEQIMYVGW